RHGKFTMSGLGPGRYTIHVAAPKGSAYLGPHVQAEVRPNPSEQEIVVRLVRGGVVHGKVIDSKTGSGLIGVKIAYRRRIPGRDEPTAPVWEQIQATTSDRGTFSMSLPAGKGKIFISEPIPGYATRTRTLAAGGGTGRLVKTVDIRAGQQIDGVVFALDLGAIAGRVFDPVGNPLAGVRIDELWHESEHSRCVTDASGRFVMTGDSFSDLRFIHYQ